MRTRSSLVARLAPVLCLASLAAAAGIAGNGCEVATAPPPDAKPMDPLPAYAQWWAEVQSCSGLVGDEQRVAWFEVPADPADGGFWCEDGPDHTCAGEWAEPHSIYLAGPSNHYPLGYVADEWTVKHEMLHDLVGHPGHPQVFDDCHLASRTPSGVYGLTR